MSALTGLSRRSAIAWSSALSRKSTAGLAASLNRSMSSAKGAVALLLGDKFPDFEAETTQVGHFRRAIDAWCTAFSLFGLSPRRMRCCGSSSVSTYGVANRDCGTDVVSTARTRLARTAVYEVHCT